MFHNPGMRNFPRPLTIVAPVGTDASIEMIRAPLISTFRCGREAPYTTSTIVTSSITTAACADSQDSRHITRSFIGSRQNRVAPERPAPPETLLHGQDDMKRSPAGLDPVVGFLSLSERNAFDRQRHALHRRKTFLRVGRGTRKAQPFGRPHQATPAISCAGAREYSMPGHLPLRTSMSLWQAHAWPSTRTESGARTRELAFDSFKPASRRGG